MWPFQNADGTRAGHANSPMTPVAENSHAVMRALPRSVRNSKVPTCAPLITIGLTVAQSDETMAGFGCDSAAKASAADMPPYVSVVPSSQVALTWIGRFLGRPVPRANRLHMAAILPSLVVKPCGE